MKQVLKLVLLWLCVAVSLTGCAEKVPMPEDGNDFGITVEQLEEGLEKERVFRVEGLIYRKKWRSYSGGILRGGENLLCEISRRY